MSSSPTTLAEQASEAYQREDYTTAAETFDRARMAYHQAGQPVEAAEMANNQSVALVQAGRFQAALEALEGTSEVFQEHNEGIKVAQSLGNQAAAYEGLGKWEQAERLYQQAAEHFSRLGDSESQHFTLQALSRIRLRQGKAIEAVSTMQSALETGSKPNWRTRLVRKILALPSRIL